MKIGKKNYEACEQVLEGKIRWLASAFLWRETPQGVEHWRARCREVLLSEDDRAYIRGLMDEYERENGIKTEAPVASTDGEADPTGRGPHDIGAKLDKGKNRLALVLGGFCRALEKVGEVGTFGADKYADDSWVSVPNGGQRYTDAMLRHLLKEFAGQTHDSETGIREAAHTAWNALARLEIALRKDSSSFDDEITQTCGAIDPAEEVDRIRGKK